VSLELLSQVGTTRLEHLTTCLRGLEARQWNGWENGLPTYPKGDVLLVGGPHGGTDAHHLLEVECFEYVLNEAMHPRLMLNHLEDIAFLCIVDGTAPLRFDSENL